ncbi:hypothetical protein DVR12_26590 [Chitinophaga silvatica]|uniref:Lipoprotein n=1 Tax=Chitinophaga silvatica TaxID=2282649 RepID=A0A3E1Y254_9BACT|nr:hypothetical protein [Chitinophaga silvatica]RFS18769.1 hypothetical protein DVR12_26590 [Chitinophaga silvatica]
MLKNISNCILLLLLFAIIIGCRREPHQNIKIRNNSGRTIVTTYSPDYPDSIHYQLSTCEVANGIRFISSGVTWVDIWRRPMVTVLNEIPSKTLMYFVYDADSAKKYYELYRKVNGADGCDSFRVHTELVLKRFDVTIEYLNSHDWTLVYP